MPIRLVTSVCAVCMCSVVVGLDDAVTVAFEPRTVAMAGDRSARDYSRQAGVGAGATLWRLAVAEAAAALKLRWQVTPRSSMCWGSS